MEETIQVEPRRDSGHHGDGTWPDHGRHQGHPFQGHYRQAWAPPVCAAGGGPRGVLEGVLRGRDQVGNRPQAAS
eukprot:6875531-Pyramimonas_sp.AAC.1